MASPASKADVGRRPGGCVPYPSPLWNGMIPLLPQKTADPDDAGIDAAVAWVDVLLGEAARSPSTCPRCGRTGPLTETLGHLLAGHGADFGEAAEWLEHCDADLNALAVHYLASKGRIVDR